MAADNSEAENENLREPTLGPACLVISILLLAVFCSVCAFGSWFMFSDQYPLAERGITVQLIPWIETSQLSVEDKESIIADLNALLPQLRERTINQRQLTRLHNCLQDNPVLLWGCIQAILSQAEQAGLTETEQAALIRISQRLLRAAAERKIGRNDVEYAIQNCAQVRENQQSLQITEQLNAGQIREYMQRAEQLVEQHEIPNESYDRTPGEAFRALLDKALDVE